MGTTTTVPTESEPRLAGTEQVKHTPGPWSVGRSCDNTPAVIVPCPDSSGFVVAHINRLPKLGLVRGDVDANARLIAAAPDMFAVLKRIVVFCRSDSHAQSCDCPACSGKAILSKIEGRTP